MELLLDYPPPVESQTKNIYTDPFFDLDPHVPKLRIDQAPNTEKWAFIPLYAVDNNGKMRMWQVGFDGINIIRRHGRTDTGNFQIETKNVKLNQSGRDLKEQSLLEVRQMYNDKFTGDGYRPADFRHDIDIQPELAQIYPNSPIRKWPVAAMAKLDGERMRVLPRDRGFIKVSRANRPLDHVTHIDPQIKLLMSFLPLGTILDGEMYKIGVPLQQIHSIISKIGHPQIVEMKYHIFDIYLPDTPFQIRYNHLITAFSKYYSSSPDNDATDNVRLVVARLMNNVEELDKFHKEVVDQGYEGLIIHKIGQGAETFYKPGKTINMLKYKTYHTEEGTVTGVEECEGSEAGTAKFLMKADNGATFRVRPAGPFEDRRRWLNNPKEVIGRRYTYKYRNKPYGVPTEVTGVSFRDDTWGV